MSEGNDVGFTPSRWRAEQGGFAEAGVGVAEAAGVRPNRIRAARFSLPGRSRSRLDRETRSLAQGASADVEIRESSPSKEPRSKQAGFQSRETFRGNPS